MDSNLKAAVQGAIVGATIGAPFRGNVAYRPLNFYEPIPVRPAPSESLDGWVVFAHHLKSAGRPEEVSSALSRHWTYRTHGATFAHANADRGLGSPASGKFQNPLPLSSQALGRSVFWGLTHPGSIDIACRFAYFDASFDHSGDGVVCAAAIALMAATAKAGASPLDLIRSCIPVAEQSPTALQALRFVIRFAQDEVSPTQFLPQLSTALATTDPFNSSINFAAILVSLLLSEGSFEKGVRIAAGLGGASDQTALVVGALLGLSSGDVPSDYLDPLGQAYVSGHGLRDIQAPGTLDEFEAEVLAVVRIAPDDPPVEAQASVVVAPLTSAPANEAEVQVEAALAALESQVGHDAEPETVQIDVPTATPIVERQGIARPNPATIALLGSNPMRTSLVADECIVSFTYLDSPIALPGKSMRLIVEFSNPGEQELTIEPAIKSPPLWQLAQKLSSFRLRSGESTSFPIVVQPPLDLTKSGDESLLLTVNRQEFRIPMIAAQRWYSVGPFVNNDGMSFTTAFRAEDVWSTKEFFNGRDNLTLKWTESAWPGVFFDIESVFRDGPGVAYLFAKLALPKHDHYRVVCAAQVGAVVWVNREKLVSYHDTHKPVPRAVQPYVGEFSGAGQVTVLAKVMRNREPLAPLVLYFLDSQGRLVTGIDFLPMD